jgi:hypothetical protein
VLSSSSAFRGNADARFLTSRNNESYDYLRLVGSPMFRVAVRLGQNVIDFCTATYQPTINRLSDYQFVLFGPVTGRYLTAAGWVQN